MPPWASAKIKVQLNIAVQRLRNLQQKKEAQAKTARREIATLIENKKLEKARVKVENIINDDINVELLELLELYCELLIARFGLLDQNTREPDPGVSEAVTAVIYAAPRTEIKELHIIREMLTHKYGREFTIGVMENRDNCVTERVTNKLIFHSHSPKLVDGYLAEIAKGYRIEWTPPTYDDNKDDSGDGGGLKETAPATPAELEALAELKAKVPLEEAAAKPVLPDIPPTEDAPPYEATDKEKAKPAPKPPTAEDEFTALAKRFEALKRK